ncbi:MAG TPA: sialidase family protein [Chloroflexota bacterium]|nr:sialidase family protein [Chloroflexota bacterium]
MRRSTAAILALALATISLQPGHAQRRSVSVPLFGPSMHLPDPSRYPRTAKQYAGQILPDDEPSMVIAPDGTVWIVALHLRYGTALWRGRFGSVPPAFVGMPDHGIGGVDAAVAIGTGRSPALYAAALVPIPPPHEAWRIALTACRGGDIMPAFGSCTFYPHLAYGQHDRPWLASYGPSTVYLAYSARNENLLSGQMTVQRSDDGGMTWTIVGDPLASLSQGSQGPLHGWQGPIVVDPRNGTVYEDFVVASAPGGSDDRFNRIVVAASHDRGRTWRTTVAYQGRADEDDGNMWPGLAVDGSGRLYAVWSDRHDVYLTQSADGGTTWTLPARVDVSSADLRTSVIPWVAAGAARHVAVAWYGSTSRDNMSGNAQWRVWYAESSDGGDTFAQAPATGVIHDGPVCTKGDACDWTQRQLLELVGLALDPRTGRAAIAYARSIDFGDYHACFRAANCPQVYYVEEIGHTTATGNTQQ